MNITDEALKLGQVKTITSNSGKTIDLVELLFSAKTKAQFVVNSDGATVDFTLNDVDLQYQDLNCTLDKDTLRSLIVNMKDIYNQLVESEGEV